MTHTTTDKSLSDAMYAMSLTKRVPDAELVDDFVRQYPMHAEALTEFAIELAVDALHYGNEEFAVPADDDTVSPMVARAMSKFQNRLFEIRADRPAALQPRASAPVVNPFESLDRARYRDVMTRIHANAVFISKLRDRQIEPDTIPRRYLRHLAAEIPDDLSNLTAHLAAIADVRLAQASQFYMAEGKPSATRRQTFEEAVRTSGLTAEQQSRLLAFKD